MSTGRRAYNLLRAYVNREWDRLKSWEREEAMRELEDSGSPKAETKKPEDPERTVIYVPEGTTHEEAACEILGIKKGAAFAEIRHAFVKLSRRSDPGNFPDGSQEQTQARDVHRKVHWAYRILTDKMSDSEKRFGSLEIE
jgi:hypothetical protein